MTLEEIRRYCEDARAGHRADELVRVVLDARDVEGLIEVIDLASIVYSEACLGDGCIEFESSERYDAALARINL